MRTRALVGNRFELEHSLWAIGLGAGSLVALFTLKLIFGQGLTFWFDLAQALPFMIAGGLCSDAMLAKILASAINLTSALGAFAVFYTVVGKLRFTFERSFERKRGMRGRLFALTPGPTIWQARLTELSLKRRYTKTCPHRLF